MKKTVIALIGNKGSGKDTFFKNIQNGTYCNIYRTAFADALKEEFLEYINNFVWEDGCDITLEYLEANKEAYRKDLQEFGDMRRKLDEDYFIDKVIENIKECDAPVVFITDMRLINEQVKLNKAALENDWDINFVKVFSKKSCIDKHKTEMEVNNLKYDYTLYNCFTHMYIKNCIDLFRLIIEITQRKRDWNFKQDLFMTFKGLGEDKTI